MKARQCQEEALPGKLAPCAARTHLLVVVYHTIHAHPAQQLGLGGAPTRGHHMAPSQPCQLRSKVTCSGTQTGTQTGTAASTRPPQHVSRLGAKRWRSKA